MDILTITYKHDHECARKDQTVETRPICQAGIAQVIAPQCIETGLPLAEISRVVN